MDIQIDWKDFRRVFILFCSLYISENTVMNLEKGASSLPDLLSPSPEVTKIKSKPFNTYPLDNWCSFFQLKSTKEKMVGSLFHQRNCGALRYLGDVWRQKSFFHFSHYFFILIFIVNFFANNGYIYWRWFLK